VLERRKDAADARNELKQGAGDAATPGRPGPSAATAAGADPETAAGADPPSRVARAAGLGALAAGAALVVALLLGSGNGGWTYHLMFENGGQLVAGNQVLVGGQPIGKVDSVTLTPDAQAEVTITVDHALHQGTTATIRATSLSGIANRYVSITPGPNSAPTLPDGATLTQGNTTTIVDLDQLFNTFRPKARRGLSNVIRGFATSYSGVAGDANKAYRYFAPSLDASRRLFEELTRDERNFTDFIVQSGRLLTGLAERKSDLAALTQNTDEALGAIARENGALDRSLAALPPTLRQANTTFVNLRAALGDLSALVRTALPATRNLAPFLADLRPVAERAVPVFRNLAAAIARPGPANDLTDSLAALPGAERAAASAKPHAIAAMNASQPIVEFVRPYSPDLAAWVTRFGEAAATYDADGHYLRVQPAGANLFHYNSVTHVLEPIPPSDQFNDYPSQGMGPFLRCPGAATQPILGSNPFLDDGNLLGECNPAQVPPGP